MIISDFTADISTLNFGTDKETQVVHDTLHAKGVTTIGELCHLSKKHIEALGLDPSLIELHLKKNGLSLGMCDNELLQHQRIASELLKNESEKPSTNKPDADIQVKKSSLPSLIWMLIGLNAILNLSKVCICPTIASSALRRRK